MADVRNVSRLLSSRRPAALCVVLVLFFSGGTPSHGLIEKLYSVKDVIDGSKVIAHGEIESVDAKDKKIVAVVKKTIKGACTFEKIKINAGVGQTAWHTEALLKICKVGEPILFFYDLDGDMYPGLAYTNGTFFQIYGFTKKEKEWWNFIHIELLMNRTYTGPAKELIALVTDILAGKATSPEVNKKLSPLTREDLLGTVAVKPKEPAAKKKAEDIDSFEAEEKKWNVEHWGQPAKLSVITCAGRGKIMQVLFTAEKDAKDEEARKLWEKVQGTAQGRQEKVAIMRTVDADFSSADRLVFEARNDSNKTIRIAFGISTNDWQYFESAGIELPPGEWKHDLQIDLTQETFKCAASKWEHRSALLNRNRVNKLTLIIENPPKIGEVLFDRIRAERNSIFVRSISLARNGDPCGVAWVDVGGDGNLAALICASPAPSAQGVDLLSLVNLLSGPAGNRLYKNDGGTYVDVTTVVGLKGGSYSGAWADYNGDGHLDLLTSEPGLFTWNGSKFRDDSTLLGDLSAQPLKSAAWIDANGDGRPDAILPRGQNGISLLLNSGAGAPFSDAGPKWGLGRGGIGCAHGDYLCTADFDGDGFPDFLYHTGSGVLARNEEGKHFKLMPDCKLAFTADRPSGAAFGDFDNDGDMDVFFPQNGKCILYRNNNDLTFTNVTAQSGELAGIAEHAQSAIWGDVNMDGFLDLVVAFADQHAELYLNDGKGAFARTGVCSLEPFECAFGSTGMAFADFDDDGDLDLLINGKKCAGILVNAAPRNGTHVPLRIRLPRAQSPGTILRLYDNQDKPLGMRQLGLCINMGSQEAPEAHYAVPPGAYKLAVLLSNGDVSEHALTVTPKGLLFSVPVEKKK